MKKISRLAVIQMSMPNYSPQNGHCPDDEKFTEIYHTHGYITPEIRDCNGDCKTCWKKSAEKEPSHE